MADIPRIVLHVGAPKTGSTYLQRRLRTAPELLRRNGVYMPVLPVVSAIAGNAKLLPVAISKECTRTFERAFPKIDVPSLDPKRILAELLRDWRPGEETLLLSAENFRSYHAEQLRRLLPADVQCDVFLFIRRHDDWTDSYYNQLIKTREISEDIDTFVTRLCDSEDSIICIPDWYVYYGAWRDAFGQCGVLFYDKAREDLMGRFLSATRLGPIGDLPDIPRTQESLDVFQLAYLFEQGTTIGVHDFAGRRSACAKALRASQGYGSKSLLSPQLREQLRARFEPSSQRLVKELGLAAGYLDLLRIAPTSQRYCDMEALFHDEEYRRFRNMADSTWRKDCDGPSCPPDP